MKSVKFVLIYVLFLMIAWACDINVAWAGEDIDTQTSIVILTIPESCHLVISNPNPSKTLIQDGTAETAFDDGYVELDAGFPTLKVSANKSWKLTAKSSGFTGPYSKTVGDLQLKDTGASHVTNGFNTFKSLSLVDQEIASHTGGVKNEDHPCQYRILLDWAEDIPGTYTATVTFTLSTNAS